ncbi:MAG: A/G-specific adenine glycosylase [Victivallales bacterium]|nr:A/G-specific adenine glycosylase [Victivallales bacterium]
MQDKWPNALISWFEKNQRQMPWRETATPYRILVSEVMLQQTQVATVIPYFHRFMHAFPTLADLAVAPEELVLKLWEGLGYYSRARHLHACAKAIVAAGGEIPAEFDALRKLPGIGDYTAAAVASMGFGQKVAVVDGNVLRVRARMQKDDTPIDTPSLKKDYFQALTETIQTVESPSLFNQAMMELGALICKPTGPDCTQCPVAPWCRAFLENVIADYPKKKPKKKPPHYEVAVGLIYDSDRLLILKRTDEQMLGGLWEFPGGKLEPGETPAQAVQREIQEETGLYVTVGKELAIVNHAYSHFSITMHAFRCTLNGKKKTPDCDRPWQWVQEQELKHFPFPKANHKIFKAMKLEN